ncbi:hypothetical protein NQ317_016924 [Molorchus minor]|uniref:DUF4771 domain-containing protein n=1 Tax=Molorchus minor TaxID=1323400 RepID=A0ABQ9K5X9_9CUCU|nr:hypothetical protein NQ317_016924 [Molorchus minor]
MSQDLKFAIGGVVNTPQGPIYIITGMRPPVECECARVLREKAEEQLRLQRAPKMPPTGRIKYEITGVKGMPDGEENVFILSQALNVDDCECMKLFNKFEEAHTSCFKIYEDFLNQIQDSLKEYNTEMEGPKGDAVENIEEVDEDEFVDEEYKPSDEQDYMFDEEPVIESALEPVIEPVIEEVKDEVKITCQPMESSSEESIEVDCTCKEGFTGFESDETVITEEYSVSSSGSSIEAVDALQLKFTESGKIDTSLSDPEIEDATTTDPKADKSKDKVKGGDGKIDKTDKTKVEKSGGEKSDKSTLNKPDADDSKRNSIKTDKEAKEPKQGGTGGSKELKRFLILEKIPSEEKEQQEILEVLKSLQGHYMKILDCTVTLLSLKTFTKKMLPTLVEDGFPLAKLPDIHKLPHFKLWMQMRCGKFWRQKDRKWYEEFSKIHWCHTDVCYREVARPDLGISKRKAKLMTWKDASFVKSIVADKVGMYYRLVKQQTIEMAREFFPISFDYEFPNKTYRDVFFAYAPAKEEDVLAFRIVKPHEARTNLKKFPCYP